MMVATVMIIRLKVQETSILDERTVEVILHPMVFTWCLQRQKQHFYGNGDAICILIMLPSVSVMIIWFRVIGVIGGQCKPS